MHEIATKNIVQNNLSLTNVCYSLRPVTFLSPGNSDVFSPQISCAMGPPFLFWSEPDCAFFYVN